MKAPAHKLLVVDDDLNNRSAFARLLTMRGYAVETAESGQRALDMLARSQFDLVLLDQMMPGMTGLDLLRLLRATYSQGELPVIMVTGVTESDTVVKALQEGANDYVTKPVDVGVVTARIQSQIQRCRSERDLRSLDPLTGLQNRSWLLEIMNAALSSNSQTAAHSAAVLLLGLDGFKPINDSFGHQAGDRVLREIADRLRSATQRWPVNSEAITLARIGSDEFVVFLASIPSESQPTDLAQSILEAVADPLPVANLKISMSGSIGIAYSNGLHRTAEDLLRDADLAMDGAKQAGKNRFEIFKPLLRDAAQTRMSVALDLHHALERQELRAVYQPEMNLASGTVAGFESLLRWEHAQRGCLRPSEFIPLAEETGLIVPMGKWILETACRQLREWQIRFPSNRSLLVNVNLSVKQLGDPNLIDSIEKTLAETGLKPESLHLELTESVLIPEISSALEVINRLRALRIGLKLDDFGTGYSSLSYLRTLQFDSLKIDRSFVARLGNPDTRAIVEMMIRLAHELQMTAVAEGIETREQLLELTRMGCDTGQGFYFARPLSAEDAGQFLATQSVQAPAEDYRCNPIAGKS